MKWLNKKNQHRLNLTSFIIVSIDVTIQSLLLLLDGLFAHQWTAWIVWSNWGIGVIVLIAMLNYQSPNVRRHFNQLVVMMLLIGLIGLAISLAKLM